MSMTAIFKDKIEDRVEPHFKEGWSNEYDKFKRKNRIRQENLDNRTRPPISFIAHKV